MKRAFEAGKIEGGSTREQILSAALRVLARDGFAKLSARTIAAEAGTNLALLNYYFGSKEKLLLTIFDELDSQRLKRQQEMYAGPDEPLSQKWRTAVAFYHQDLADGYVGMLQELTAHGYSNPVIAQRMRETRNQWRALLEEVAATYLPALGIKVPPAWVASAVVSFWLGMETQHLIGSTEEEGSYFAILDAVGDWIDLREQQVLRASGSLGRRTDDEPASAFQDGGE
jgi:AcrR family transcriptional regulator